MAVRKDLRGGEVCWLLKIDIIILGGMGLKYDDYLFFRYTLEEYGALSGHSIVFMHTAADPVVECLLVPDISLAVAESFALEGKRILVLLTDMSNFCDALNEVAITMQQIPSNRGYPGDLYSLLAARYEKAVDFESAGSITILAVTTMPGDDVTHPIPDNTGYITEGQFYLKNGVIEPFGSLSRLKQLVNGKTREDHRTIMDTMPASERIPGSAPRYPLRDANSLLVVLSGEEPSRMSDARLMGHLLRQSERFAD